MTFVTRLLNYRGLADSSLTFLCGLSLSLVLTHLHTLTHFTCPLTLEGALSLGGSLGGSDKGCRKGGTWTGFRETEISVIADLSICALFLCNCFGAFVWYLCVV